MLWCILSSVMQLYLMSRIVFLLLIICLLALPLSSYKVDYNVYHNYSYATQHILSLTAIYGHTDHIRLYIHPNFTSTFSSPLYLLQYTNINRPYVYTKAGRKDKLKVLISFTEHARELITLESFFYLIVNLTEGITSSCDTTAYHFSSFISTYLDLHLLPLMNPDGKRQMEMKGDMCWRNNGRSVDLNRNADWQWGGEGGSGKSGHEEYRGTAPFSEVETSMIHNLSSFFNYTAYLSIHSGERQFFTPFVDTKSRKTKRRRYQPTTPIPSFISAYNVENNNYHEWKVGQKVMKGSNGWFRNWGIGWEMNSYSADGTLYDYMAGVKKVPYCYCVELWGGPERPDCFEQFNPAPDQMKNELAKMHLFYVAMFLALIEEEFGVVYSLPAFEELSEKKREGLKEICKIQNELEILMGKQLGLT